MRARVPFAAAESLIASAASMKEAAYAMGASHTRERMPQPRMRAGRRRRRSVSWSSKMES